MALSEGIGVSENDGTKSLAHGGKDGHPFPVPLTVYDETLRTLKSAVQKAKLGRDEELAALKRLDDQARQLERYALGHRAFKSVHFNSMSSRKPRQRLSGTHRNDGSVGPGSRFARPG